jgi:hypothetical protein
MICCFWNCRGISAPGRQKFIDDNLVPLHLDYIGFQETKKEHFSNSFLKKLLGNRNFIWNHLPAVGSACGILVGVNGDLFEVIAWEIKTFSVSVVLKNKISENICRITTVYGSAYEKKKQEFISEIHELFLNWDGPAMIGGDFNLIRSSKDKNNLNIDYRWVDKFNTWVEMWALLEIGLAGRAYTWSNNQEDQVMCKLDRIFCTTNFDDVFPLSSARALARIGSDHTPIIWESGESHRPKKGGFKFEKWWLANPEFKDLITKAWSLEINNSSTLDR